MSKMNDFFMPDSKETKKDRIVFDERVSKGCRASYPGYPAGCPQHCVHPNIAEMKKRVETAISLKLFIVRVDMIGLRTYYRGLLNQRWWQGHARSMLKVAMNAESSTEDIILGCGSWDSMESAGILVMDLDEEHVRSVTNINPPHCTIKKGTFSSNSIQYQWPATSFAMMGALLIKFHRGLL